MKRAHRRGDIVELCGIKFVVLDDLGVTGIDDDERAMFVLALEPQGKCSFGDFNDYAGSSLETRADEWLESLFCHGVNRELFYKRRLHLKTLDGNGEYGGIDVKAAPLNIDEARKYAEYIPKCEESYWLATGWGGPLHHGEQIALFIECDGSLRSGSIAVERGMRPALVISSLLLDGQEVDLRKASDEELLEEIHRRFKRGEADGD